MNEWYDDRTEMVYEFQPIVPEVWESDNPVVATLLGPDGEVLCEFTERPVRQVGFRPGGMQ